MNIANMPACDEPRCGRVNLEKVGFDACFACNDIFTIAQSHISKQFSTFVCRTGPPLGHDNDLMMYCKNREKLIFAEERRQSVSRQQ
jgi:hypothetical protein